MSDNDKHIRWYDADPVVSRCLELLQDVKDSLKRQTATFLMGDIITKPPYVDMLPEKILDLINKEDQKRRWYDFDEVVKIFIELLRHSSDTVKREICVIAITFIENLSVNRNQKIEFEAEEEQEI